MRKRIWSVLLCGMLVLSLIAPAFAAFRDVPAAHWAAEDISYVTQRGLFYGTSSTTFGPSDKMSRAMLATVLYRYAQTPPVSGGTPYEDVLPGQWYTAGVVWAYQNEIFSKLTRETRPLRPGESVRRAEFCIMLYNFAKSLNKAQCDEAAIERAPFTDMDWERFGDAGVGPSYYEAREAMLGWAWPQGIMGGTSSTTIDPMGTITRAEVAAMLARFDRNVLGGVMPEAPAGAGEGSGDGYTLANGKPITEENVQEILQGLRETYPSGSYYPSPYRASSSESPYGMGAMNCAGWAALCSDAIFGILPCRRISNPSWDQIRVGDLIEYDTETSGHVVVVTAKTDEYFKITDSGKTQKVLWGGQYFRWWMEEQPGYTLVTRYPL